MKYTFTDDQLRHISAVKEKIRTHAHELLGHDVWVGSNVTFTNVYLLGGAIASLLQQETPKDWDFYFADEQTKEVFVNHLTKETSAEHIKDVDAEYAEVFGVNGKMITGNAITLGTNDSFITLFSEPPEEIKNNFDYVHCMPHYSISKDVLYISPKQYYACTHKKLIVNNEKSIRTWRTQKFRERGYTNA